VSNPTPMSEMISDDLDDGLAWDMWRSQPMQQFKFCIPRNHDRAIMSKLIDTVAVEFVKDSHADDSSKLYIQDINQCSECDRKLRLLVSEVNRYLEDDEEGTRAAIVFKEDPDAAALNQELTISQLSTQLTELEAEFTRNDFAMREITLKAAIKREHKLVAERAAEFLEEVAKNDTAPLAPEPDCEAVALTAQSGDSPNTFALLNLCGVVLAERTEKLQHALFRVCYGKVLVRLDPLPEPMLYARTGRKEAHCMLIVMFTSEDIRERVAKICRVFDAHVYDVTATTTAQVAGYLESNELTDEEIDGVNLVVQETLQANLRNCHEVAVQAKHWNLLIRREAILLAALNGCSSSSEYLYIRGWVPDVYLPRIEAALKGENIPASGLLEKVEISMADVPPTFMPVSKYTECLQGVVDKYGIARYRELNPGLFALVFFPFLFGVMFGDILHGLITITFAGLMIVFEAKLEDGHSEVVDMIFGARYAILSMGVCATYMGFIYNEMASLPLDFGSSYSHHDMKFSGSPYLFGMDPVWRHASEAVQFTNSLKMKMAVTLGVSQMTLGIVLKMRNASFFNDQLTLWHEALPEFLFFVSTVGYMVVLVFIKWATDWQHVHDALRGPPQIINEMINFVMLGDVQQQNVLIAPGSCTQTFNSLGKDLGTGPCTVQTLIQRVLLCIAAISVPWILLVKPLSTKTAPDLDVELEPEENPLLSDYLDEEEVSQDYQPFGSSSSTKMEHVKSDSLPGERAGDATARQVGVQELDKAEALPEFSEVMVEQVIHTIEFVLGTISNTASYLRLWALSLAHSQLSEVFMDYIVIGKQFNCGVSATDEKYSTPGGVAVLVVCTVIWVGCTICVIMAMESLSAFLHALRLQWVEFQGKFYKADGVPFLPATFKIPRD